MDSLAIAARQVLTELGILEDSGERALDKNGVRHVKWQLSPLGRMVVDYQERLGLTVEQALAKINASGANGVH